MTLYYDFEMRDWLAFQENYFEGSKRLKRTKIITMLMVPVIFAYLILLDLIKGEVNPIMIIILSVIAATWMIIYPLRFKKRLLNSAKRMLEEGDYTGVIGPQSISIDETGIRRYTPDYEVKMTWRAIKKIKENDDYFFLYTSAVSAITIPKKKIPNDVEQLDNLLKQYAPQLI